LRGQELLSTYSVYGWGVDEHFKKEREEVDEIGTLLKLLV
jgi:hypothetical protein